MAWMIPDLNSGLFGPSVQGWRVAYWYVRERQARALGRKSGGAGRDRTDDLLRAKQALSQLSYSPDTGRSGSRDLGRSVGAGSADPCDLASPRGAWWVWVELNHRPHPYQGCALTN